MTALFFISRFIYKSGDEEDRTPGLGIANAALSQLSYVPVTPSFPPEAGGEESPLKTGTYSQ